VAGQFIMKGEKGKRRKGEALMVFDMPLRLFPVRPKVIS
jgi:hypothetical protein